MTRDKDGDYAQAVIPKLHICPPTTGLDGMTGGYYVNGDVMGTCLWRADDSGQELSPPCMWEALLAAGMLVNPSAQVHISGGTMPHSAVGKHLVVEKPDSVSSTRLGSSTCIHAESGIYRNSFGRSIERPMESLRRLDVTACRKWWMGSDRAVGLAARRRVRDVFMKYGTDLRRVHHELGWPLREVVAYFYRVYLPSPVARAIALLPSKVRCLSTRLTDVNRGAQVSAVDEDISAPVEAL